MSVPMARPGPAPLEAHARPVAARQVDLGRLHGDPDRFPSRGAPVDSRALRARRGRCPVDDARARERPGSQPARLTVMPAGPERCFPLRPEGGLERAPIVGRGGRR